MSATCSFTCKEINRDRNLYTKFSQAHKMDTLPGCWTMETCSLDGCSFNEVASTGNRVLRYKLRSARILIQNYEDHKLVQVEA